MKLSKNLTLDREFIIKFPVLKAIRESTKESLSFRLEAVDNGMLFLANNTTQDDIYINIAKFSDKFENLEIVNYSIFEKMLKDAAIEQEIINYQSKIW